MEHAEYYEPRLGNEATNAAKKLKEANHDCAADDLALAQKRNAKRLCEQA